MRLRGVLIRKGLMNCSASKTSVAKPDRADMPLAGAKQLPVVLEQTEAA
jgi:hypothetical protein